MADIPTPDQEQAPSADDQLRQKLLGRIAVAAIVIVGLLGSLAMFDALYGPATPTKVASAPPLPATAPAPAAPVTPSEPAAAAATPPVTEPASTDTARAETPADGKAAVPVPPLVDNTPPKLAAAPATSVAPEGSRSTGAPPLAPLPPEKPLTKPASPRQAAIRPSEPAAQAVAPTTRPDAQRELARSQWSGSRGAPASKPLSQPATAARQFALQLGVFNNLANAEDLRAKLELHGIPSTIEARVQVGPFKTREDVESAREKLKALGMDSGIMISLRK